jgi:hypothetical protein
MQTRLFALAILLSGSLIHVASATQGDPGSATISNQEKEQALTEFMKDFQANYVFPDLATKTDQMLQAHLQAHDYDSITSPQEFVKTVNQQIQEVSPDAHLHLAYSERPLDARKAADQPTKDEIDRTNRMERSFNGGFESAERLPGNIGYIEIRGFMSPQAFAKPAQAAMQLVENTNALIFDVRRNGGGWPESVQIICSYLFDKPTHLNDLYYRDGNKTFQYWTKRVPGKKYLDKPIYVLVSHRTGSGAEEFAYDLQNLHRATIIGDRTWGGANPGDFFTLTPHIEAFIPKGRAINPYSHANWEGTGVTPDIKVESSQALIKAQELALGELLSKSTDPDEKTGLQRALDDLAKGQS